MLKYNDEYTYKQMEVTFLFSKHRLRGITALLEYFSRPLSSCAIHFVSSLVILCSPQDRCTHEVGLASQ